MPDTIAAIATPPGEGGLHVIRLSGPESLTILRQVFTPATGKNVETMTARRATMGNLGDPKSGDLLDTGLVIWFPGPRSFTGEDVVEISCHGGVLVSQGILQALLDCGARLAEAGEFTRRAFVNGKLDLTQAEAVTDLIHADSERAKTSALSHLQGRFSKKLEAFYDRLLGLLAQLETAIDFPEEGLEFTQKKNLQEQVQKVGEDITALSNTFKQGRIVREGLKVVLVGKPNVGKSSLLNALLGEDRAIVTQHPGTTRDVLEESIRLKDFHLTLLDTAGIREQAESIEAEGIARTRRALSQADVALLIFDGSAALDDNDRRLIEETATLQRCAVINKSDLPQVQVADALPASFKPEDLITLSAKKGNGLDVLRDHLYGIASAGNPAHESLIITRERHHRALNQTAESLKRVCLSLADDRSEDLVAVDMNCALEALGGLTGKDYATDLLDQIFDDFCIGK